MRPSPPGHFLFSQDRNALVGKYKPAVNPNRENRRSCSIEPIGSGQRQSLLGKEPGNSIGGTGTVHCDGHIHLSTK